MSGRPLHAVLRLLPGSLYQSPDNPLQVDRLPEKTSGVELDYPVYQDRPAAQSRQTLSWVTVPALAAPLLAWVAHLIPVPLIHGGANTVALLIAAGLIVLGFCGRWWSLGSLAIAIVVLPICAQLVRDVPYALVAELLALIGTALLADALITNYVWLKTAAPVARARSQDIRAAWDRRWTSFSRPLRGAEGYGLGYLVLLAAGWYLLRSLSNSKVNGNFWGAFRDFLAVAAIGLLWSVVFEAVLPPLYGRAPYRLRTRWGAFRRAVTEWCTYNRLNTHGVGVHTGPVGNCIARRYLLAGVILTWACLWAGVQLRTSGLSHYFQSLLATMEAGAVLETWAAQQHQPGDHAADPAATEPNDEPLTLSPAEQQLVSQLPSAAAENYLRERDTAHRAAQQERRDAATEAEATSRPAGLLVQFGQKLAQVTIDVLVPSLWTLAVAAGLLFGISSRALAGVEALLGTAPRERILSSDNWEMLVDRVQGSHDPIEQDSVLLGTNARDDTPVLATRIIVQEHVHILGDTGSGKTTRGLLPLITQLMRFGDCSVIVIDLKADDQTLFECLRTESERLTNQFRARDPGHAGYAFRWFTTVMGRSSFAFNPLTQSVMAKLSPDQRTDVLTAALGLNYGNDYGRKYYGDSNYDVLNYALRKYPDIQCLAELEGVLAGANNFILPTKTREAGTHVQSSIRRLSRIKALSACPLLQTPQPVIDHAIDLDRVFAEPQALYVALPTSAGISNTAEIARIFLYSLMEAAQHHPKPRKQVYLVVDEFQRIVSKNVELFLQQARSMNIGCILSNQSLADLDSIDADLIPAVRGNTRLRQVFGAGNQTDIDDLLNTAGETVYATRTWNFVPGLFDLMLRGVTMAEHRGTRLTINDILLATDAPGRNITCIRRGDGYAQFGGMPFVMDAVHHVPKRKYEDVLKAEWPPADERMVVAATTDGMADIPPGGPPILGGASPAADPSTGADSPNPVVPEWESETSAEPPTPSEVTSEGIEPDLLTQMYEEDKRRFEQRRERRRKRRKPPSPDNMA